MRGWLALGAIIVAVLANGAATARAKSPPDRSIVITGGVTYVWHGDVRRGCAADDVCGLSGAITVTPPSDSDLLLSRGKPAELGLGGGSVTVRVRRLTRAGAPAECVESTGSPSPTMTFRQVASGSALASISSLPISHCATPLTEDMSHVHLSARYSAQVPARLAIRGRVPFVSGPYSGMLISTLATRPDSNGSGSSTSFQIGSGPQRVRPGLVEYVDVRYRLAFPALTSTTTFSSGDARLCSTFDACGVSGSIVLRTPSSSASFRVAASRLVRRRVGAATALSDLKAGRLTLSRLPFVTHRMSGSVTATTTRAGVPDCTATRPHLSLTLGVDGFDFRAFGHAIDVSVTDGSGIVDALRAFCPGPLESDLDGNVLRRALFLGRLPIQELGPRQVAFVSAGSRPFSAIPYHGRQVGAARVTLVRVGLSAGTRSEKTR